MKEYPRDEWEYLKSGIPVKTDDGELFYYTEANEDFDLIGSNARP
jgi:hypothetical protein